MRAISSALAALAVSLAVAEDTRPILGILTLPADDVKGATSYFPAVSAAPGRPGPSASTSVPSSDSAGDAAGK